VPQTWRAPADAWPDSSLRDGEPNGSAQLEQVGQEQAADHSTERA